MYMHVYEESSLSFVLIFSLDFVESLNSLWYICFIYMPDGPDSREMQ